VFDLVALEAQLKQAREVDSRLVENLRLVRHAVDQHEKTLLDLAAAEASSADAHTVVLNQEHDVEHQRFALRRALGLPPETPVVLSTHIVLPTRLSVPPTEELLSGLEAHRLDLSALRKGYESQEQALRAAVLGQFPKINIGFNRARDNTNVNSWGYGATVDLPIFDRNQGVIATETATRQRLFDEYTQRVFETRSDVASAAAEINSVNGQIEATLESIPKLQLLVKTYERSLARGNVDVLSYYTAINSVSQKQIELLKLEQQLIDDRIALEIAIGAYLPDSAAQTRPTTTPATEPTF
jgi:cobalt-zinc-cadmium efflux system outer membrane protein